MAKSSLTLGLSHPLCGSGPFLIWSQAACGWFPWVGFYRFFTCGYRLIFLCSLLIFSFYRPRILYYHPRLHLSLFQHTLSTDIYDLSLTFPALSSVVFPTRRPLCLSRQKKAGCLRPEKDEVQPAHLCFYCSPSTKPNV